MPDQLQLRGGTTAEHTSFTGASKEVTIDTTKKTAVVHDASTAGGNPLMREDGANSALINGSATEPALAFAAGDADNGIYSPGADQVAISTAGEGRLFVAADGKVGLGTATVDSLLHLQDSDSTAYDATDANGQVGIGPTIYLENPANANNTVGGQIVFGMRSTEEQARIGATGGTAPAITFGTADAERMRIASDGKVGIGQTSPGALLDVNGDALINGVTIGKGADSLDANTAIGGGVLGNATTGGENNTGVGYLALEELTTGTDNTGIGVKAGNDITSGVSNTFVGRSAGEFTSTSNANTGIGYYALLNNDNGDNNSALGFRALEANVAGDSGVAIGTNSQRYANNKTTGWTNTSTSVGYASLMGSTTAANNTGLANTAIGYQSMSDNTSGATNVAVGYQALYANTAGNNNIAVGGGAMGLNTDGGNNVAIGTNAFREAVALNACTAVGYEAQRYADSHATPPTAGSNTSVGYRALRGSIVSANNTGTNNSVIGVQAMQNNTSGSSNSVVGVNALYNNTTGSQNSAIGQTAGRFKQDGTNATDLENCTCLGYETRASGDNQVQLGNSSTTTYAYGAVQDRSDERDKADIRDTVIGLDFINSLRPVDFRWDMRDYYFDTEVYEEEETETVEVPNPAYTEGGDEPEFIEETRTKMVTKDRLVPVAKDGSRKRNRFHHGLIAQEVKAAADAAGVDFAGYQDHSVNGGKDVLTIGYSELIAPLIKAVQELTAENAAMKARLDALETN